MAPLIGRRGRLRMMPGLFHRSRVLGVVLAGVCSAAVVGMVVAHARSDVVLSVSSTDNPWWVTTTLVPGSYHVSSVTTGCPNYNLELVPAGAPSGTGGSVMLIRPTVEQAAHRYDADLDVATTTVYSVTGMGPAALPAGRADEAWTCSWHVDVSRR